MEVCANNAEPIRSSGIFLPIFRRLLFLLALSAALSGFGANYRYFFLKYRENGAIYAVRVIPADLIPGYAWVQSNFPAVDGTNPYYIKGTEPYVWVVQQLGPLQFDVSENDYNNLNNYLSALDGKTDLMLFDYGTAPDTGVPKLWPVGHVYTGSNGEPVAVVGFDAEGNRALIPVSSNGDGGFSGVGYDENGNQGLYTVGSAIDGTYPLANFTPSGSGGNDNNNNNNINTNSPPPVNNNIPTPATDSNGKVSTPTSTVNVPDGNGGQSQIVMRDYTPLLSQIAQNQIEGINRNDTAFSTLNQNLEKIFTVDSVPNVALDADPDVDFSSVSSEASQIVDDVSGWGFSFGYSQNPIGGFITSLIGNPPTSFGKVDQVWNVEIPIYGDVVVTSTFRLSDYFIPAFRSCVLMILTIVFAIAIAKQVSDAWT